MASQFQATGWISTSKPSKPSGRDLKVASSALYQTSMHEFLRRKPKSQKKQSQKENMQMITPSNSRKRKIDEAKDRGGKDTASKKQKKVEVHTQGLKLGLGPSVPREPSRGRQNSKDYHSSLFVGPDSRGAASLDFRTALDSVRVDLSSVAPQWPMEGKEGDRNRSENILESSQVSTFRPINQVSVDLVLERRISSNAPFVLPAGASSEIPDTTLHGSHSHEDGWPPVSHPDINFLVPSSQTLDALSSLTIPTGLVSHPPDRGLIRTSHDDFIVPSSQSQHLLPYDASPPQSPLYDSEGECSSLNRALLISNSQSHLEMDLQTTTPHRCGNTSIIKHDAVDPPVTSITGERMPVLASPSEFYKRPVTTSVKTTSRGHEECLPTIAPSGSLHSPPHQHETHSFTPAISPFCIPSSQTMHAYSAESFPSEVTDFLDLLEEDRRSLGPEFRESNLGLSAQDKQDLCGDDSRRGRGPEHASPGKVSSFEPPLLHDQSIGESFSSNSIPIGRESEYTFVEESYPPDVIDFLDGLDQDRSSLGPEFEASLMVL